MCESICIANLLLEAIGICESPPVRTEDVKEEETVRLCKEPATVSCKSLNHFQLVFCGRKPHKDVQLNDIQVRCMARPIEFEARFMPWNVKKMHSPAVRVVSKHGYRGGSLPESFTRCLYYVFLFFNSISDDCSSTMAFNKARYAFPWADKVVLGRHFEWVEFPAPRCSSLGRARTRRNRSSLMPGTGTRGSSSAPWSLSAYRQLWEKQQYGQFQVHEEVCSLSIHQS